MSKKVQENIQVSVVLPGSPRGLIGDHTGKKNGGNLSVIMQRNFGFCVKTYLKFEQCRHSCGVPWSPWGLSREASRHAAPIHKAPFISPSDMLSVMVQRGSILIVWTDHSWERVFDIWCWQNRHSWVALVSCLSRSGAALYGWFRAALPPGCT